MRSKAKMRILVSILLGISVICGSYAALFGSLDVWAGITTKIYSHNPNNPGGSIHQASKEDKRPRVSSEDYEVYEKFPGMEKPYTGSLPWEKDARFTAAIREQKTPVLMAAYKASLPDPVEAEGYNIGLAAKQLAGSVVQPGETFSQNKTIGPYTGHYGYQAGPTYVGNRVTTTVGGGVCKVASLLYNVVTFSDLKVIMRDSHSMTVPYVPPGQDATVYYGVRDFRFLNDSEGPVLIWSQKVENDLYMALYGQQKPPQITWHHLIKKRTKYWTEHRYNSSLPPSTEKVIAPGQDGYVIKSWVEVEKPGGIIISKSKGTSWYNASPRIIEHGPR